MVNESSKQLKDNCVVRCTDSYICTGALFASESNTSDDCVHELTVNVMLTHGCHWFSFHFIIRERIALECKHLTSIEYDS